MIIAMSIAGLVGLALIGINVWERMGRSRNARAWLMSAKDIPVHRNLMMRPGLGGCLLAVALVALFPDVPAVAYPASFLGLVSVILLFWGLLQIPYPMRFVPAYARPKVRQWKQQGRE